MFPGIDLWSGSSFDGRGEVDDAQQHACQLDDMCLLFECGDDPLVLRVLFIFST